MTAGTRNGRGRPPVMDREERVHRALDAAATAFAEKGYAKTSIEEISRLSGMSRRTIYALFESKDELFAALVRRSVPMDKPLEAAAADSLEEAVEATMAQICEVALAPRQIALLRLAISEAHAAPELATVYYQNNVERGRRFLADRLEQLAKAHGWRQDEDFDQLSDILFGAVVAGPLIHALTGDTQTHTTAETHRRVHRLIAALFSRS